MSVWGTAIGAGAATLLIAVAAYIGHIGAVYWRVMRINPVGRRLLPTHVVLVSAGTLVLAASATARVIQFPLRPFYTPATFLGLGLILAALVLVDRWQRHGGGGR